MKKWDWKEQGQFVWHHEEMNVKLDLKREVRKKGGKEKVSHWIREAYRRNRWKAWLKCERRAVEETGRIPYDEERCKKARMWAVTEVQRTIMCGGFVTPAAIHAQGRQEWTHMCPWCHRVVGNHDHIFWECRERPRKIGKPQDRLQRRLGWPVNGASKKSNLDILGWMEEVAREVWKERYGQRWYAAPAEREDPELEDSSSEDDE